MGHAGAIISGGTGTAAEKMAAFEAAGIAVARIPSEIPALVQQALQRRRKSAAKPSRNGRPKQAAARRPASRPKSARAKATSRKVARKPAKKKSTARSR
jgi:hypothetical protein